MEKIKTGQEHEPTDKTRSEVTALYSYGIPQEEIGRYIGIDAKTLRKYYRSELDSAHVKAHAAVGRFLYQNATGATLESGASHSDCVRAAMFWAKTRMGWRETQEIEQITTITNKPAIDYSKLSKETLEELRAQLGNEL